MSRFERTYESEVFVVPDVVPFSNGAQLMSGVAAKQLLMRQGIDRDAQQEAVISDRHPHRWQSVLKQRCTSHSYGDFCRVYCELVVLV